MSIVNEFLNDLHSIPPERKIDFGINFLLDTQPIFIPPYRRALVKLKELKEQLRNLLDKEFIRPSVRMQFSHVICEEKGWFTLDMCGLSLIKQKTTKKQVFHFKDRLQATFQN